MENGRESSSVKLTALVVSTMAAFLTPFMSSAVNIALKEIGDEFHMNAVLLGWVATSFLLAAVVTLVPFGKIADIYGRKRIFIAGLIVYTISSYLVVIANDPVFLIFTRVLQGIGGAMIFGTSVAILTSVYPREERGKVLGINVASTYLGLSIGPFLGGVLTEHFGWRSIFLVNVPIGLIIIALVFWKLKGEWAEAKGEKFDLVGSILFGLSMMGIAWGLPELPSLIGALSVFGGVIGLIIFIAWELRVEFPVLNMRLFKGNAVFAFSNLAALINYSATYSVSFLLSLYLQYIKDLSPEKAGIVLVWQPVMMTIFSPVAGRLSDRIDSRIVASIGMALTVIGLGIFATVSNDTHMAVIIAGLIVLGFGFALFSSPNTNAVMSSVNRQFYGVASATLGTMRLTGQMMSMGISQLLFALIIGNVTITPEYYPQFLTSVRMAFGIFAVLNFIGIFASLARGNIRTGQSSHSDD
ncbi:MAG: MFS transporter [bacterium]